MEILFAVFTLTGFILLLIFLRKRRSLSKSFLDKSKSSSSSSFPKESQTLAAVINLPSQAKTLTGESMAGANRGLSIRVEVYHNKDLSALFGDFRGDARAPSRSNLVHVATVETSASSIEESLREAYQKTQSANSLCSIPGITFHQNSMRSTSVGDVMAVGRRYFKVSSHGFQPVQLL